MTYKGRHRPPRLTMLEEWELFGASARELTDMVYDTLAPVLGPIVDWLDRFCYRFIGRR